MFVKAGSVTINLDKVSNIAFKDEFSSKGRGRIIFNFCYSIQIKDSNNNAIFIPDYKYYDIQDQDIFYSEMDILKEKLKTLDNFIEPSSDYHYWVNKNHISYISKDVYRKKIIFNLSTPISKNIETDHGKENIVINDFVFWSFDDSTFMTEIYENTLKKIGE